MKELRFNSGLVELQAESRAIFGYGAVFDAPSQPLGIGDWQFIEKIDRSAFDDILNDPMVMVLANHDINMALGRTGAGTAEIGVDERGLWYRVANPPKSREDIVESIQRNDIFGSSFGFEILEEEWNEKEGEMAVRTIKKVKRLYDAGPVTYPAYLQTSVNTDAAARSYRSYLDSVAENSGPSNLYLYKIKLLENSIII